MDITFTENELQIRDSIVKHCSRFSHDYWLEKDQEGEFSDDFFRSLAYSGRVGIAMPERFGDVGRGITETAIMMQAIAESGPGMSGASSVHINIFGLQPLTLFGTEDQQRRAIPDFVAGSNKAWFAVTEPNVSPNTTQLKVRAERKEGGDLVNGGKIWISIAQVANKILRLARTTLLDQIKRKTDDLSLFHTDFDRSKIETRLIHKMDQHAVDSNIPFIEDLWVPEADLIGEEGQDLKYILEGLNRERVLLATEAVGPGRAAIRKEAKNAKERIVFNRPIGKNQGIQHPPARCRAQLEAANLMTLKAATLFDTGEDCGVEANTAKCLAGEFAFEACHTATLSMGGMGYAQEYHVERYLRESLIPRTAPVSPHMILNFLVEKVLDLPKS